MALTSTTIPYPKGIATACEPAIALVWAKGI